MMPGAQRSASTRMLAAGLEAAMADGEEGPGDGEEEPFFLEEKEELVRVIAGTLAELKSAQCDAATLSKFRHGPLARFTAACKKYQEQPELLDPHLSDLVAPLVESLRANASAQAATGSHSPLVLLATCEFLKILSTVRGHRVISAFLPNAVADFEPALALLFLYSSAQQTIRSRTHAPAASVQTKSVTSPNDDVSGSTPSMPGIEGEIVALGNISSVLFTLLQWISLLCLLPFALAIMDSSATGFTRAEPSSVHSQPQTTASGTPSPADDSSAAIPPSSQGQQHEAKLPATPLPEYRSSSGGADVQATMSSGVEVASSDNAQVSERFFPEASPIIRRLIGVCIGFLSAHEAYQRMAALVLARLCVRRDLPNALASLLAWAHSLDEAALVSVFPGLAYAVASALKSAPQALAAAVAEHAWAAVAAPMISRSSRQGRAQMSIEPKLLAKLALRCGLAAARQSAQDAKAASGEVEVPSLIEDALGELLEALRNEFNEVRWTAAKGVAAIVGCLPKTMQGEVLDVVLNLLSPSEGDSAWHGGCLALAEAARRRLLQESELPKLLELIIQALRFERLRGAHGIGSHVRNAASYVCWALSRVYPPSALLPAVLPQLCPALLAAACLDNEVSCRRAAAAAFQETVGRQGGRAVPHGIEIVTTADFVALGSLRHSFCTVAVAVAQYPEYRRAMLEGLQHKTVHWNERVRRCAAEGLSLALKWDPAFVAASCLPALMQLVHSHEFRERHGALIALAHVIPALSACQRLEWHKEHAGALASVLKVVLAQHTFHGKGTDSLRIAACSFLAGLALAMPALDAPTAQYIVASLKWHLSQPIPAVQDAASSALSAWCICSSLAGSVICFGHADIHVQRLLATSGAQTSADASASLGSGDPPATQWGPNVPAVEGFNGEQRPPTACSSGPPAHSALNSTATSQMSQSAGEGATHLDVSQGCGCSWSLGPTLTEVRGECERTVGSAASASERRAAAVLLGDLGQLCARAVEENTLSSLAAAATCMMDRTGRTDVHVRVASVAALKLILEHSFSVLRIHCSRMANPSEGPHAPLRNDDGTTPSNDFAPRTAGEPSAAGRIEEDGRYKSVTGTGQMGHPQGEAERAKGEGEQADSSGENDPVRPDILLSKAGAGPAREIPEATESWGGSGEHLIVRGDMGPLGENAMVSEIGDGVLVPAGVKAALAALETAQGSVEHVLGLGPALRGTVLPALLRAMGDYTRDKKGDVGRLVREEAMAALCHACFVLFLIDSLARGHCTPIETQIQRGASSPPTPLEAHPSQTDKTFSTRDSVQSTVPGNDTGQTSGNGVGQPSSSTGGPSATRQGDGGKALLDEAVLGHVVGAVAKQAAEKIDKTLIIAGGVLQALVYQTVLDQQGRRTFLPLPDRDLLADVIPAEKEYRWTKAEETFPRLVQLLASPVYRRNTLLGFIASIGGFPTKQAAEATGALASFVSSEKGQGCIAALLGVFAAQLQRPNSKAKAILPPLKTLTALLEFDEVSACLLAAERLPFWQQTLALLKSRLWHPPCDDTAAVNATVDLLCKLVPAPALRKSAVEGLISCLAFPYPKVQQHASEQLYLVLMSLDQTEEVAEGNSQWDMESLEKSLELISSTEWDKLEKSEFLSVMKTLETEMDLCRWS